MTAMQHEADIPTTRTRRRSGAAATSSPRSFVAWSLLILLAAAAPAVADQVVIDVGTLPPGRSVTITYRAMVGPLLPEDTQIVNQGLVTGSNFPPVQTDDPNNPGGPGSPNPTMTEVYPFMQDIVSGNDKGSVLIFSKVDIRWDAAGNLLQDTFLSLTNDHTDPVRVQLYMINGDPPLDADPATGERAHPGWNWTDNVITLTGDQPTYWSALTGDPATGAVAPFTVLDPGLPRGRPVGDGSGDRMLRGYVLAWAVDFETEEIRWNHLAGSGTIVNYADGWAWEYSTLNHAVVVRGLANGMKIPGTAGELHFDGLEYSPSYILLGFDFEAVGSSAFSGPRVVLSDTDLTLHALSADLRDETEGPVTTRAIFDVWNGNEVKFSGVSRCITCWDETLLSDYGAPNHFLVQNLQTDHGKARVDGRASQACNVDYMLGDGPIGSNPLDVVSQDAVLVGVVSRLLSMDGGVMHSAAGTNLTGMGIDTTAVIRYDLSPPPPEAQLPFDPTPEELANFVDEFIQRYSTTP